MREETTRQLSDLVKRNYEQIAQDFDTTRRKEIGAEMRQYGALVKEGSRVLDAGCGNGRLLEVLKDKRLEYLGIDGSAGLIERARRNYPEFEFAIADIENLELGESKFDFIFCLAVIQHLPGRNLRVKALRNLAGALADDGCLIISVWNLWSAVWPWRKYRWPIFKTGLLRMIGLSDFDRGDLVFPWKNSQGKEVSQRYYHAFTEKELRDECEAAGLKVQELKKDFYNYWLVLRRES